MYIKPYVHPSYGSTIHDTGCSSHGHDLQRLDSSPTPAARAPGRLRQRVRRLPSAQTFQAEVWTQVLSCIYIYIIYTYTYSHKDTCIYIHTRIQIRMYSKLHKVETWMKDNLCWFHSSRGFWLQGVMFQLPGFYCRRAGCALISGCHLPFAASVVTACLSNYPSLPHRCLN